MSGRGRGSKGKGAKRQKTGYDWSSTTVTPEKTTTENGAVTFASTGNSVVDYFFQLCPDTPKETHHGLLNASWGEDATSTLRLIYYLRGVRRGKNDRDGFHTAMAWLWEHAPKTFVDSLTQLGEVGCYKDALNLLVGATKGDFTDLNHVPKNAEWKGLPNLTAKATKKDYDEAFAARVAKRKEGEAGSEKYALLWDAVADLFAKQLLVDWQKLEAAQKEASGGKSKKKGKVDLSLCAKWAPGRGHQHDRRTLISQGIANRLAELRGMGQREGQEKAAFEKFARCRYQEVLTHLRRATPVIECFMGNWSKVPYNRLSSQAMNKYAPIFMKNDPERFGAFLSDVSSGKRQVAAGSLLPHEVVKAIQTESEVYKSCIAQAQWTRMVKDTKERGSLKNCMAVADVSGSMYGIPMEVSVALSLLIAEVAEPPFNSKLITFSENPAFHVIAGDTVKERINSVTRADWGMSTNLHKVFQAILALYKEHKVPEEEQIHNLFIFSDMEFNQACGNNRSTNHEAAEKEFTAAGFKLPAIVYWNLRSSSSVPACADQPGVKLMSGFSPGVLGDLIAPPKVEEEVEAPVEEAAEAAKEGEKMEEDEPTDAPPKANAGDMEVEDLEEEPMDQAKAEDSEDEEGEPTDQQAPPQEASKKPAAKEETALDVVKVIVESEPFSNLEVHPSEVSLS